MDREYPKSHITTIGGLNALSLLVGLAMAAYPFIVHMYPGALDTTDHVGVGALIALLAAFRILLAYGAIWIDIVLFVLGLVVFLFPTFQHMRWSAGYNMGHMIGGVIVMAVALISLLITRPARAKMLQARH